MSRKSVTMIRAAPWSATSVTVSAPVLRNIEQLAPETPETVQTPSVPVAKDTRSHPTDPPERIIDPERAEAFVLVHRDGAVSLKPKSAPSTSLIPLPPRQGFRDRVGAGAWRSTRVAARWLAARAATLLARALTVWRRANRAFLAPARVADDDNAPDLLPLGMTLIGKQTVTSLGAAALLIVAIAALGIAGYLAIVSMVSSAIGLPDPVSTGGAAILALLGTLVPAWVLESHRTSRAATTARLAAQLGLPLHRHDDESRASERFLDFAALCLGSMGNAAAESALRHLSPERRASLAVLLTGAADKAADRSGLERTQRARLAAAGGALPWANSRDATAFLRGLDGHMRKPEARRTFQSGAKAMERFVVGDTEGCRALLKPFLESNAGGGADAAAVAPIPTVLLSRALSPVHKNASPERIVALHKVLLRDTAGKKSTRSPQQRGALIRVAFPDAASAAKAAVAAMRAVDRHNMRYPELAMRVGMALAPHADLDPETGIDPIIRRAGVAQIVVDANRANDLRRARIRVEGLGDKESNAENDDLKQLIWW